VFAYLETLIMIHGNDLGNVSTIPQECRMSRFRLDRTHLAMNGRIGRRIGVGFDLICCALHYRQGEMLNQLIVSDQES
jgi:hypothetical protein